ncbi:hypothetical protein [Chitinophaga solisilvae]|uniref:Uncharacterized protein n=1 Tax=Chitinophaga solisilvae TaxID=1233460 RepID=A0A433WMQ9_9BACT|nr:hypothetical protein [Chitinophaga solisilvae]NSL86633.1 hypothetical protein [Chitinophaga solisilvae]
MKKILIASTVVGSVAAGLILLLANRDKARRLLDKTTAAADDAVAALKNKYGKGQHNNNEVTPDVYSNAMG